MSALYVANPKVYNGVMRKLERLQDEWIFRDLNKADTGRVWRVLDELMDALKEARPDVYNDLVHSLQRK